MAAVWPRAEHGFPRSQRDAAVLRHQQRDEVAIVAEAGDGTEDLEELAVLESDLNALKSWV